MRTCATILSACLLATLTVIPTDGCASDHSSSSADSGVAMKHAAPQLMFDSPQAAVDALVDGARRRDRTYLRTIFGPDVDRLTSGDTSQDDIDMQAFVVAYDVYHAVNENNDDTCSLVVGEQEWVFPAPIAPDGQYWYFDTAAGVNEVITRTVGLNELNLIETMDAFVEAQEAFFAMDPDDDGVNTYAAALMSTPGKRDGLYWPDEEGAPISPIGPLIARAVAAGQLRHDDLQPYRGYYFRILTSQGAGAEGGTMSYIDANGRMTLGYALLAWPASYNETGVMSFIIARSDVAYQKDLGEDTVTEATAVASFDPSDGWQPVE